MQHISVQVISSVVSAFKTAEFYLKYININANELYNILKNTIRKYVHSVAIQLSTLIDG
jgi:hypothetical protein